MKEINCPFKVGNPLCEEPCRVRNTLIYIKEQHLSLADETIQSGLAEICAQQGPPGTPLSNMLKRINYFWTNNDSRMFWLAVGLPKKQ